MKTDLTTEKYPLSPMQQGMLFHNLSASGSGVDVEQIFCTLHENVDDKAFERAWRRVIERHAILRTSFEWQGQAGPLQKVLSQAELEFLRQDWRNIDGAGRKNLFEELLESERKRGFDPARAPLMRLALLHTSEHEWRFLWTFHHLLLDGRAVVMVLNEVFAFYEAFQQGEDMKLPPPCSFRDFVERINQYDADKAEKAEKFWRKTLKGFTAPTPLTIAHASDNKREIRGEQQIELSGATTAALRSIAKEHKLTLNTFVQGAWALLLSRYSGEDDVAFGAVRAGRHSTVEGAESIVGLCINTVPVRIRVPANSQLLPWLAELRNAWIALREFEHTPLVEIQRWSEVPHDWPLFESIFNFQDPSWDTALRIQGGKWASREFGIASQSNYPLVVDAYGGDRVLIKILYHRNRFDDDAITRMLGHFSTLLDGMAANPGAKLCDLPILTKAEREQLLGQWIDTSADFPQNKCVHEFFEEQAGRTPDALAVADEKRRLTYRELDELADQIALQLRAVQVGPDVCVGVCMERSVEMVAAKLAVWKAGGAYVPLDPAYPAERLKFMLEDAKMPALITQKSLRDSLRFVTADLKLVYVNDLPDKTVNGQSHLNPPPAIRPPQPKNLAYVIYTSGSTGQPKGVEIEHRSLANLIAWHQRTYNVTPQDRATQIATPAFDASVWELWPYLTCGASIHIPNEETRLSPKKLLLWLTDEKITLAFIPTPVAETTFDEPWPEECAIRAVLTGGDKLHRPPGKKFPAALVNHYGPTENTVVTTASSVPPMDECAKPPPIGRPIANTRVFILDKNLQPLPVGIPGELHISGAGLARGYHNHPDLTAEKFVPNPFSPEPGARLYKTGDQVRWLADGQIEFIGRLDTQVKIRGQRIEPGEIEAALEMHPGVNKAVVVSCENSRGENRLAAYVVPKADKALRTETLREFLKPRLPKAMLPSAFVLLDTLPLTSNGKIDRKALPAPDFKVESERPFVAPRTPVEEKLTAIWCEVLGIGRVGIHDDFFDLGGHSLSATQIISRLPSVFQARLALGDLFDSPTIAGLAEKIGPVLNGQPVSVLSQSQNEADEELPLSFAQERLWFMEQLEPGLPFNNIPIGIRLEGEPDTAALEKSITEIIRRHKTLRTVFKNLNGHPVAKITPAAPAKIQVIDLSSLSGAARDDEAHRLMTEEARLTFDFSQSPLLRMKLIRFSKNDHLLLLTTHHIACDGWSMSVFYRELTALYGSFSQGQPSSLPELTSTYSDFSRKQRDQLSGEVVEKHLTYWKQQLEGAPTAIDLPADQPRPPVQTYRGTTKHLALPRKLSTKLTELARRENVTTFMLLLGAFQTLLHRYTGQEDILTGSPIAGRTMVETEGLIGVFLNTLCLRGDLSGDPTFRELLQRVRKTALAAYAHQDLPFEKLVDALQPKRDLSRSPLFQVMFVLQNEPLQSLDLTGIKTTPVQTHSGTAKFDLMLSLEEGANGLSGFIEYSTDLFNESTITRLIGNYETLLEGVVKNAEQRLSQLPLLTRAEQNKILVEWNNTGIKFQHDKCIHELFEEQAQRTPDDIALVFEDEELTYRELNRRADDLARRMKTLGVGPDVRVGVYLKRSIEMMAGLLGILKAGGCYVPLDPTYPQERLKFMLEDSRAAVLLIGKSVQNRINFEAANLKLLCMDGAHQTPRITQAAGHRPQSDNLAYVIYTSGSTGKPKGVMVTHRNVVNFFAGMDRELGTKPGVWFAVTSISFDISVLELFWTLAHGFKVVIQSDDDRIQPAQPAGSSSLNGQWRPLPEQISRHGVTHMQCTPSLARTLLLAPGSHQAVRSLRMLLLGGEALPVSLAQQLRELAQGGLLNMYGPTETTIWSTMHRINEVGNSISIGRPIANTSIYILDKNLQPMPVGVPGEIFIGGAGTARGYLNQPGLTAERFIQNPFGRDGHDRIYRTGDLGRWLENGTVEFLGRIDNQVKIRGHRVELGEIESALGDIPAVREAVVVAREDSPCDTRLVAYIVGAPGSQTSTTDLRRFLQRTLPEAMMPSAFVFLEALPLTPNGKLNRKALPAPENRRPELEVTYLIPRSSLEKSIASIWQELLHVEKVGLNDNFFDLGGNSLLVVQAQARLRETLGRDLPVVKLFQHPTVGGLANFLGDGAQASLQKTHDRGQRKQAAFARRQRQTEEILA